MKCVLFCHCRLKKKPRSLTTTRTTIYLPETGLYENGLEENVSRKLTGALEDDSTRLTLN